MFQDSDGFKQLLSIYTAKGPEPIGLYIGAGVNLPTEKVMKPAFDYYSWEDLLRAIYNRNLIQYHKSFIQMKAQYDADWQGLAEALVGDMSIEKLVDEIDMILYHCMPRGDKDGRLSKKMLDQAPTLHAVICFTAQIKGKWKFERNPKIDTVITPNYDFFFGAGWTRYQAFRDQWKIYTPFSEEQKIFPPGTIFYIHGYIPYRRGLRKEIVLARESYDNAYHMGGFARKVLEEKLQKCHLIFIGTSFNDQPMVEILKQAKKKQYDKQYFSIEKSPSPKRLAKLDELGVIPIPVENYADFAVVLESLYCAALTPDKWMQYEGLNSAEDYWKQLKKGPRG